MKGKFGNHYIAAHMEISMGDRFSIVFIAAAGVVLTAPVIHSQSLSLVMVSIKLVPN